jgi:squalene synthase HpnC
MSATAALETPSGKWSGDENFPVGSFLLPAPLRPHVARYYAFARTIDDIADNPALTPEEKVQRLDAFDRALIGENEDDPAFAKAYAARASFAERGIPIAHCRDLVVAFKQDAVKLRYRDWDDLMGYCINSASPVGRFLLDLHGEDRAGYTQSDALCNALQVINHLQDAKDDYLSLNRVYVPEPWLQEAGCTVQDLAAAQASPGVRRTLDRLLDGVDGLLVTARDLPGVLRDRRLAMESAFIVRIAERLTTMLRTQDPIAGRVELSKLQFAACGVAGVWQALTRRRPPG